MLASFCNYKDNTLLSGFFSFPTNNFVLQVIHSLLKRGKLLYKIPFEQRNIPFQSFYEVSLLLKNTHNQIEKYFNMLNPLSFEIFFKSYINFC